MTAMAPATIAITTPTAPIISAVVLLPPEDIVVTLDTVVTKVWPAWVIVVTTVAPGWVIVVTWLIVVTTVVVNFTVVVVKFTVVVIALLDDELELDELELVVVATLP
jgi:hypothetical protein